MSENTVDIEARVKSLVGTEYGRVYSWHPVNQPMIDHWCDALGNRNPLYRDPEFAQRSVHKEPVAPPTMLQVWVMRNIDGQSPPGSSDDNPFEAVDLLLQNGYPAVVAVNSEQEYFRYLRPGESLTYRGQLESVSDRKTTALGVGYFVTVLMKFYSGEEFVGTMRFRLLLYRAHENGSGGKADQSASPQASTKPRRPRPGVSPDTEFFWKGLREHKLLIQKCAGCGRLRHPPGPACPHCRSLDWQAVESSGRGVIHSFVTMHHPEIPPFEYPNSVVLVELEEGVRIVAGVRGLNRSQISIGVPVQADFLHEDDDLVLPLFRPR